MKVYIVYFRNWDDFEILDVFGSKESAEVYISVAANCRDYTEGSLFVMEKDVL